MRLIMIKKLWATVVCIARSRIIRHGLVVLISVLLFSCIKNRTFDALDITCNEALVANISYQEVKNLYTDQTIQIREDFIIEGYVISSDKGGNFFSVLHFQDKLMNASEGFQIEIDLRDSHLFYPVGSKIAIKLKGLYLAQSKGIYKIGGVFSSFGNLSVGRLPASIVQEHLFLLCDPIGTINAPMITLQEPLDNFLNTLVQFNNMEFIEEELGETYAVSAEATLRILKDCEDKTLGLQNSGYSDFQNETLPEGNGSITGILQKENDDYFLLIRDLEDINFENERCPPFVDEFTSTNILISEIADPNNNSGARFIELYNSSTESFSLKGWSLRRYTNANTTIGSLIDLTGNVIAAESTFVISPNASEFEIVYGFAPDLSVGTGSAADSNGDDNIELVDPFGVVIDVFGIVGEDGTETNHEFEDGRAVRNASITQSNAIYSFSEWQIYNDSGAAGTINMPQNAPEDFNPSIR